MASQDRRSPSDLKDDLFGRPEGYSFYQVVRLLRRLIRENGDGPSASFLYDNLRVRPPLSLGFPGTDVFDLKELPKQNGKTRFLVTAPFLGLYGVSSPLPTHYTEELFEEASNDNTVTRNFLDILCEPFYRLLFQCWTKYRWGLKVVEEQDPDCLERLSCLMGLGSPKLRSQIAGFDELLRYLGLLTMSVRSAAGLQTLLSDALEVPKLRLTSCVSRRVAIPQGLRCRIGQQANRLGKDCYLGQEVEDRMGKIRIRAESLDPESYHDFLPSQTDDGKPTPKNRPLSQMSLYQKTQALVSIYLFQPMEYELELVLKPETVRTVVLGEPLWSCLGLDSWVFSGQSLPGEARVTFQC